MRSLFLLLITYKNSAYIQNPESNVTLWLPVTNQKFFLSCVYLAQISVVKLNNKILSRKLCVPLLYKLFLFYLGSWAQNKILVFKKNTSLWKQNTPTISFPLCIKMRGFTVLYMDRILNITRNPLHKWNRNEQLHNVPFSSSTSHNYINIMNVLRGRVYMNVF